MNKKTTISFVAALFLATNLLSAQTLDLGEIEVVSATKSKQSIQDVTSNVEVITSAELEEKHITTVTQALNLLPGISYVSNGGIGSSTTINLRGMSNNRVLILIDGIRYQDPSNTSGSNIAHLMIGDIERIEVIKGAQSGVWGADASAGVINIITKSLEKGVYASVNVEAGSFNTKKIGAIISNKTDKYDVKLSFNKIVSDSFTNKAVNGEDINNYEDDKYKNRTINFKFGYKLSDNTKAYLNYTNIDALKEYDRSSGNDDTMKSDIETKLYDISLNHKIADHDITLKIQESNFYRDEIGTTWGVKVFNGKNKNIELNDKVSYNKKDMLIFGIGENKEDIDYIKADDSTNLKQSNGKFVYATNINNFDKLILTESLRYDAYNNFENKVTGKAGLKYNFNGNTAIFSNYGTAYNVPSMIQSLNPWGSPTADLKPESSKTLDLGVSYKALKMTYFKNQVKDLIAWGAGSKYENTDGKSRFEGFELDYKDEIVQDLLLSLNYTRLSAKDDENKNLARRANQILKFGLDYYGIEKLHIGLNGEYIGKRYDSADNQGAQTGKYAIANLIVNYDIKTDIKVYAKIDNITDKYYQTVNGYATSPRAGYVGIKVKF